MSLADAVSVHDDHVIVRVRLTPKSSRDGIDGLQPLSDGTSVLAARVRAVPEKGAANAALEKVLAKALRVGKTDVAVVAGGTARLKTVRIDGDGKHLAAALSALVSDA